MIVICLLYGVKSVFVHCFEWNFVSDSTAFGQLMADALSPTACWQQGIAMITFYENKRNVRQEFVYGNGKGHSTS